MRPASEVAREYWGEVTLFPRSDERKLTALLESERQEVREAVLAESPGTAAARKDLEAAMRKIADSGCDHFVAGRSCQESWPLHTDDWCNCCIARAALATRSTE